MKTLQIIKIGGNITDDAIALEKFLEDFSNIKGNKILVHGGGKTATKIAEKLGIVTEMREGRRITDAPMLDVAIMVYAGLTSKKIVAQLQKYQCNALGLTGADLNLIQSKKRPVKTIDYGLVGDVEKIDAEKIDFLLQGNITPVFCALTHDQYGQLLNTNADTIASQIAIALSSLYETTLMYCFEKKGVLRDINDENSMITHINQRDYQGLKQENVIHSGMIPKLDNAFEALQKGVKKIIICEAAAIAKEQIIGTTLSIEI